MRALTVPEVPSSGGVRALAYTMVAERENQTIKKQRASALIMLANARVWESEGWRVMITDTDGKEFNPAAFAEFLGPGFSWSPQQPLSVAPSYYEAVPSSPEHEDFSEETEQTAEPALAPEPVAEAAPVEEIDAFAEADTLAEATSLEEADAFEEAEAFEDIDDFEEVDDFEEGVPFAKAEHFVERKPFEEPERFDEPTSFEELEASYGRLVAHQ